MSKVRKIIKLSGSFNSCYEMVSWSLTGFMLVDSSGLIIGYIKDDAVERHIIGLIGNELPEFYRINILQDEEPDWAVSKEASISFEIPKGYLDPEKQSVMELRNTSREHPNNIGAIMATITDVTDYVNIVRPTQDFFSTFDPQFACNHGAIKSTLRNFLVRNMEVGLEDTILCAGHNDGYSVIYETVKRPLMQLQNA